MSRTKLEEDFGGQPIADETVKAVKPLGFEDGFYSGVLGMSYRTNTDKFSSTDVDIILLSKINPDKSVITFVESKLNGKDITLDLPKSAGGLIFVVRFFDMRPNASQGVLYYRNLERVQFARTFDILDETDPAAPKVKWSQLVNRIGIAVSFELFHPVINGEVSKYAQIRYDAIVPLGTRATAESVKNFYDSYEVLEADAEQAAQESAGATPVEPLPF
jgi:hypothetical protein